MGKNVRLCGGREARLGFARSARLVTLGLRYVAPVSTEARVIQHTTQLTPRLSEPTLVTVSPCFVVARHDLFLTARRASVRLLGSIIDYAVPLAPTWISELSR